MRSIRIVFRARSLSLFRHTKNFHSEKATTKRMENIAVFSVLLFIFYLFTFAFGCEAICRIKFMLCERSKLRMHKSLSICIIELYQDRVWFASNELMAFMCGTQNVKSSVPCFWFLLSARNFTVCVYVLASNYISHANAFYSRLAYLNHLTIYAKAQKKTKTKFSFYVRISCAYFEQIKYIYCEISECYDVHIEWISKHHRME